MKFLALASKPEVLKNFPVLGLRTALFFESLKVCGLPEKFYVKRFFFLDRLKNFSEDFFFWRALAPVSLVLGLELSCPWPQEVLSSEGLSMALASDFFVSLALALASSLVSSTPPLFITYVALFKTSFQ